MKKYIKVSALLVSSALVILAQTSIDFKKELQWHNQVLDLVNAGFVIDLVDDKKNMIQNNNDLSNIKTTIQHQESNIEIMEEYYEIDNQQSVNDYQQLLSENKLAEIVQQNHKSRIDTLQAKFHEKYAIPVPQ